MTMKHAGFLLHSQDADPLKARARAAEVKPWVRFLPARLVYSIMPFMSGKPDIGYADVTSARTNETVRLHFGGVGMSGEQLKRYEERAVRSCADCLNEMYEIHNIEVAGLGAHTASIGNGGLEISKKAMRIPIVTTGNSATTYFGIESTLAAAGAMHIKTNSATLCIVGVSGNIGRAVGQMIRSEFDRVILVPHSSDLTAIARMLDAEIVDNLNEAINLADVVITSTTSSMLGYNPEAFKPGSVVVVLSRPRDVAKEIMELRDDVLAIEGGNVQVPCPDQYVITRDIEQPLGAIYPCMTEAILIALDKRKYGFSMGPLQTETILSMGQRAEYHGFKLAPGFRFHREITPEEVEGRYEAGQRARRRSVH